MSINHITTTDPDTGEKVVVTYGWDDVWGFFIRVYSSNAEDLYSDPGGEGLILDRYDLTRGHLIKTLEKYNITDINI
jgi:hypothetical protein